MDRAVLKAYLAQAEENIALTARHIKRQREIISELASRGHDTLNARELLRILEELQTLHVSDRNRFLRDLDPDPAGITNPTRISEDVRRLVEASIIKIREARAALAVAEDVLERQKSSAPSRPAITSK
jgi:arginine repressor